MSTVRPPNGEWRPEKESAQKINAGVAFLLKIPCIIEAGDEEGAQVTGYHIENGPTDIPHPDGAALEANADDDTEECETEEIGEQRHCGVEIEFKARVSNSLKQSFAAGRPSLFLSDRVGFVKGIVGVNGVRL